MTPQLRMNCGYYWVEGPSRTFACWMTQGTRLHTSPDAAVAAWLNSELDPVEADDLWIQAARYRDAVNGNAPHG